MLPFRTVGYSHAFPEICDLNTKCCLHQALPQAPLLMKPSVTSQPDMTGDQMSQSA